MAAPVPPKKQPGLESIHRGRADRTRGKFSRPTGTLALLVVAGLGLSLVAYQYFSGRELSHGKGELLGKQKAVAMTVGKEWFPLRDRIEKLTLDAAGEYPGDMVDPAIATWNFQSQPGIYLRTRLSNAHDTTNLRDASAESVRDGFTGCFLRYANPAAARGEPDASALPDQPWNLRQAYASTRILNDAWKGSVEDATDALRLRVFEQQYDTAIRDEIPKAIDIVKHAEFYLLVLDEDPAELSDAGLFPTEEAIQLVPHPSRVFIFNLATGKTVLRVRRVADASFMMAGGAAPVDDETRAAMQRQVNNCALAQEVRKAFPSPGNSPGKRE